LPHPALEEVATAQKAPRLAAAGNDEMAALCARYPDRFPAFVATIALTAVESTVAEADRAITQLGAKGIQIYSNVAGRPLDLLEFDPIFAVMAKHELPIWLHPARTVAMPDYARATDATCTYL
jgi:aminocarboxymuconate-semialdehyde decarboxylase